MDFLNRCASTVERRVNLYFFFKFLHISGILLWIGPPLGAYWIFLRTTLLRGENQRFDISVRRAFIGILTAEHIGLLLLTAGFTGMLWATRWTMLSSVWVLAKLGLFVLVIVPIEVFDIYLGQIVPLRLLKKSPEIITPDMETAFSRYDRFTRFCVAPLLLSWAAFFYLAIVKP